MDEQTKRMIIRNLAADLFLDPQDKHVDGLSPERKKDFKERLAAVESRMKEIHISGLGSFVYPSLYPESSLLYDGICAKCCLFTVYDRGCSKCGFSHVLSLKIEDIIDRGRDPEETFTNPAVHGDEDDKGTSSGEGPPPLVPASSDEGPPT